jgi:hypothetical protein
MNKSESIKAIAAALLQFDSDVAKISKSATNPFFKNSYAPLPEILDSIKEPLINAGLIVKQFPSGEHELTTIIIHAESGEYLESTYKMQPAKNDPQGEGSRITYQRRYALGAVLGLNIDEDDDGNKASGNKSHQKSPDDKQWLNPGTDKWNEAIKFLVGGGKIDVIKQKYNISKTNQELLISQAI